MIETLHVTVPNRGDAVESNLTCCVIDELIHAAKDVEDLRIPPGNRLERLVGDHRGRHSIRVNAQWRICFVWTEGGAEDVELVDYH